MKILKPFSIIPKKESAEADYFRHRQAMRFMNVLGMGIQKVADDHAQKIIDSHREVGQQLDATLKEGFEGVQEYQREIHHALIDQTQVIKHGFDSVEVAIGEGFDRTQQSLNEVANRIDNVGGIVVETGDKLSQGLMGIKSSLDMGMMGIVSQFELQRTEFQQGFKRLTNILENNRKTEARERYLDGKQEYERYLQHPDEPQFLVDAHDYLQESIEIYRGNPFCHLYLGHIFQEPAAYYDLEKSLKHYNLCATYAKGIPNPHLTALGYFLAGWISYIRGDVTEAIKAGEQAREFDPEGIPENYYNLAKYYACNKDDENSLKNLDTAIHQFDPYYVIKADTDPDFHEIRTELDTYFVHLREDAAYHWDQKLENYT